MTQKTVALASALGLLASIDPDAYAAGTVSTGWISAANWQDFLAVVSAGDLGAGATLDAKIEQASDSAGTGAKDVVGAAITQLTQAGADSNSQAIIALSADDLDIANGFNHFRLSITVGTATSDAGGMVFGGTCRYGPAADYDAPSVSEIVIL
ncbi:MAG: hypothetical protein ACU0B9_06970 [Limimaricola soesokkakensis]|uniref:hypothetical protein n=1 Tax=Limimaricola soesokkakensis TaxID=1343159 RepID=UPI00405A37B7